MYKKLLACFLMLCGSIAFVFNGILPSFFQSLFILLGIISIPLFAHALVTGFLQTRNSGHYFIRLSLTVSLAQIVVYLFISKGPSNINSVFLVPMFALLTGFGFMYGMEILIPTGPLRIASMRLLKANAQSKSDRFDIRIAPRDLVHFPPGLKVPNWPIAILWISGVFLIAVCLVASFFIPIQYGALTVFTILIFYVVEKVKPLSKAPIAFFSLVIFLAIYLFVQFRLTGVIEPVGVSIATVFICYLPEKKGRPKRWIQYAFYLFYPFHFLLLTFIRFVFFQE